MVMQGNITRMLDQVRAGEDDAVAALMELVYSELRSLASVQMAGERANHTLQPTALVHEAVLRLLGCEKPTWQNRAHFYGAAAEAMRRILVDHARARGAMKRGGDRSRIPLDDYLDPSQTAPNDLIRIDEALSRLSAFDERKGRIVQLRYFAGLSIEETADVLETSVRTVKREWRYAKAWLYREITRS
jgi:RNA polymerase sigma factor (TIGR02999 family)